MSMVTSSYFFVFCFHQVHVMISSLVAVSQADKACEPIRALHLGWKGVGVLSQCQSEGKKSTNG